MIGNDKGIGKFTPFNRVPPFWVEIALSFVNHSRKSLDFRFVGFTRIQVGLYIIYNESNSFSIWSNLLQCYKHEEGFQHSSLLSKKGNSESDIRKQPSVIKIIHLNAVKHGERKDTHTFIIHFH